LISRKNFLFFYFSSVAHYKYSSAPLSRAGSNKNKFLAGENFREWETVFTTPPDATTISISIHYSDTSVKNKCHRIELLSFYYIVLMKYYRTLFCPSYYSIRYFVRKQSGQIMILLVGLPRGFMEDS